MTCNQFVLHNLSTKELKGTHCRQEDEKRSTKQEGTDNIFEPEAVGKK